MKKCILLISLILVSVYAGTLPVWSSSESEVGKIAFCSSRAGNWEIYVMNADGSNPTRLTHNSAYDMDPSWSPDGSKIAFWSYRDGNYEIYIMKADGSNQTRLTHNSASDTYPDWSPDGKRIAFHSYRDGNWEIYVMNADGSNQTRLTNNPGNDWEPSWSSDGKRIAFHSSPTPHSNGDLYVMNADGSNKTQLTHTSADEQDPAWSPDGTKIAFESNRDGDYEIYVMNADGSNQTRLTHYSGMDSTPTWSSDGTRLVFARDSCWEINLEKCSGKSEIYIMDANGGNELRLTNNRFEDDMPDWSVVPMLDQPPQARFTFSPAQPTVGQSARFDASESFDPNGTITAYTWTFGDGTTGSGRLVTHAYEKKGTFTATLTVTDDDGASASTSQSIEVVNRPPQADFSFTPSDPSILDEIQFTDSSTDPDGEVVSWHWDFGDGTALTERNPMHHYEREGSFTITLRVTDNDSLTDEATQAIVIEHRDLIQAEFTFHVVDEVLHKIHLDASTSIDTMGTIVRYEWDWDSDGVYDTAVQTPAMIHRFEGEGPYQVILTIIDDQGNRASCTKEVVP